MSIVFLILKIIGFILLAIISFILLLLLIVIFFPIKFKINGSYNESFTGIADFSWFFRFISFKIFFGDENKQPVFKILFHEFGKSKKKETKIKKTSHNKKIVTKETKTVTAINTAGEKQVTEEVKTIETEATQEKDIVESKTEPVKEVNKEISTEIPKKTSFTEKIKGFFRGIKKFFIKIKGFFMGIKNFFIKINEYIEKAKALYNHPDRKEVIRLTKDFIILTFKKFKIKKFNLYGEIGFTENPDRTAYIIGAYSVINARIKKPFNICLKSNFDEDIIRADLYTYGYFYLGRLLIPFVRYVLSKPIWKIVRKYILT